MFIVVNYDTDFGLDEYGRYETRKEAFAFIARNIETRYDYRIDMDKYPFDDSVWYDDDENDRRIAYGNDWCNAWENDFSDAWRIIEA